MSRLDSAAVMPRAKPDLSQLGSVELNGCQFRADLKFREDSDKTVNIRGPSRTTEEQARQDLEQIRKAGEKGETREEGLERMRNEAQGLKTSAQYEAEIRETLQRRDSIMDESDYEDDDMSDNSEPPWIQEYTEDSPEQSPQSNRPTLSPIEATAELSRFRPIKATPDDLKHLLESRADPNMPVESWSISPLQNVMTFAREKHVAEMRELLLQHGAEEKDEDKARWELRKRADFCERIRINNYNSIDKDYDPCSGSVEY